MANIFGTEVDIPFIQNPFTNNGQNKGAIPFIQNPFNYSPGVSAGFIPETIKKSVQAQSTQQTNPAVNNSTSGQYSSSYSGSGGGGGGSSAAANYALYDDQINQVNAALGRLGNQRSIGNSNIDNAYSSALNKLLGQNAIAERDYGVKRQGTIDDNVNARARVDDTVSKQSAGLRRLLGNNSSAALYAAPLAVAKQGNMQLGDIQTAFSRNLQGLDTANEDRKRAFDENRTDLNNQTQIQRNSLAASLAEREAGLLDQLSQLQTQKAQAAGQSIDSVRGITQANNARVNALLNQIDQLGLNPAIAAKSDLKYVAPDLAQYNTSDINITPGQSPVQTQAGQFYNLLGLDDKRNQQLA